MLTDDRESIVPDEKRTYEEQAALFFEAENYIDALIYYTKAAEIEPSRASLSVHQGHCLRRLERYGEALASYEYACKMDPQLLNAYHGICRIYLSTGECAKAESILSEVYKRNLQNALSYSYKGNIFYEQGYFIAALNAFEKAILDTRSAKNLAIYYYNKALALSALDRYDEAMQAFKNIGALYQQLFDPQSVPAEKLQANVQKLVQVLIILPADKRADALLHVANDNIRAAQMLIMLAPSVITGLTTLAHTLTIQLKPELRADDLFTDYYLTLDN